LAECRQVQRARIWAIKIDPVSHAVTESRAFSVGSSEWALDPFIAQNNDWEDISIGPVRRGSTAGNLVIAATGDADGNRVLDPDGRDITCDTRRLIELPEPNLADPAVATWTPWKIFDVENWVGLRGLRSCNVESLLVSRGESGGPTAFMVTKSQSTLLSRSLAAATGRDPGTPRGAAGSASRYRPSVTYVGALRDSAGLKVTAADSNDSTVSLVVPMTIKYPCQLLTWRIGSSGLGAALTGTSPVKDSLNCDANAEGVAYTRDAQDPSVATDDLIVVSDTQSDTDSEFPYWYLPDA